MKQEIKLRENLQLQKKPLGFDYSLTYFYFKMKILSIKYFCNSENID